jgi:hypothetical protein
MDAARAAMCQGWPLAACPENGAGEGEPGQAGPYVGARPFGPFWEGGYPTFAKRDSPEGAKQETTQHAEAAQNTAPESGG